MAEVFLRGLSRWQAEQQRDAFADISVTAYRGIAGAEYRDREGFLRRFEAHVQRPGFDMVVAEANGPVACAYGFAAARTGEWWAGFRGEVPAEADELTSAGKAFVLADLMVVPGLRRRGIATRMRDRLLTRQNSSLILMAVDRPAEPGEGDTRVSAPGAEGAAVPAEVAATVLSAWGWVRIEGLLPGPGTSVREVWVRRPLR